MSGKFIPNGDVEFVTMAEAFAGTIATQPERYATSRSDSDALTAAVAKYRETLTVVRTAARSAIATKLKDEARSAAERIVRRLANVIRASHTVEQVAKIELCLRERTGKAKPQPCPQAPPRLRFLRALHEGNGATPMHELEFRPGDAWATRRAEGAVRLELFVDLIPPEEAIPIHPGANHGGRPWYLRSYTRSPIVLAPPMARVPMRVIYWGRWADSGGNVGPFSATAVAWIEGGTHGHLPGCSPMSLLNGEMPLWVDHATPLPNGREGTISVVVMEAQVRSYLTQKWTEPMPQLEAGPRDARQLKGPAEAAA